jgi:hypothetical protein
MGEEMTYINMRDPIRLGRFEVVAPDFFFIPLKRLSVEVNPVVNRTYLLDGDRIVAVGLIKEKNQ